MLLRRRPPEPRVWDNLPLDPPLETSSTTAPESVPLAGGLFLEVQPAGALSAPCRVLLEEGRIVVQGDDLEVTRRIRHIIDEEYALGAHTSDRRGDLASPAGGFRVFARDPSTGEVKRDRDGRPVFSYLVGPRDPLEVVLDAVRVLLELKGGFRAQLSR
ncbi:MAG: hypothetical protein HY558_01340 [Euryarchaeota archaeon]|nr:hypothetical protein [Euryarchaeota archaeon]